MVPPGIEPGSTRCKRAVLAVGLWDLKIKEVECF